jgi:hypothetical protein
MQSEDSKWAYIAGMFDGEGYFSIFKHTAPSFRLKGRGYSREFRVTLSSKSLLHLQIIQQMLGNLGTIYTHKKVNCAGEDAYSLRFYPSALRIIFPKILPHLILKKESAAIIVKELEVIKKIHQLKAREYELLKLDALFEETYSKIRRIDPNGKKILNDANQTFWTNPRGKL